MDSKSKDEVYYKAVYDAVHVAFCGYLNDFSLSNTIYRAVRDAFAEYAEDAKIGSEIYHAVKQVFEDQIQGQMVSIGAEIAQGVQDAFEEAATIEAQRVKSARKMEEADK